MIRFLQQIAFCLIVFSCTSNLGAQKFMSRNVEVSFLSKTQIENIEAQNNQVSSLLDASNGKIVFQVPIRGFHFEIALMEEHFNENYMESDEYPNAILKGQIENWPDILNEVTVQGTLTIHGVEISRSFEGTMRQVDDNWILTSKFSVNAEDFDIKIPSIVRKQIAEDIVISVNATLNPR